MGNMLYEFIGLCEFIGMLCEFTRTYGFRHVIWIKWNSIYRSVIWIKHNTLIYRYVIWIKWNTWIYMNVIWIKWNTWIYGYVIWIKWNTNSRSVIWILVCYMIYLELINLVMFYEFKLFRVRNNMFLECLHASGAINLIWFWGNKLKALFVKSISKPCKLLSDIWVSQ